MQIPKDINASVIFHVIKLAETWKKNGDKLTEQYGITTQQWLILLLLANDPNIIYLQEHPQQKPLMAKELAQAMNVTRANVTNLINVLLGKGLIVQVEDDLDKRRKRLILSAEGERLLEALEPIRHQNNELLFASFTREEKIKFIEFIRVCLRRMKQVKSDAPFEG